MLKIPVPGARKVCQMKRAWWMCVLTAAFVPAVISLPSVSASEPPSATKAPPMTGATDARLAPFDDLLSGFIREREVPGAALAVSKQGRLVYSRGVGYADVDAKTPVEPDALFRIASISKPITAVAVLQLVEQGRLQLDDRVTNLLDVEPWLLPGSHVDPRLADVTVLHLLQHTGGWDRDASLVDPMFHSVEISRLLKVPPPAEPAHIMRYVFGRPLDFDPGARYAYSNFGYLLLGRIIEKITSEGYESYVRRAVLGPLGITGMRLGKTLPAGRVEREVRYYATGDATGPAVVGNEIGKQVPWPYGGWYLEAMDAHGGWIASAPDLVRFASAFDDPARSPLLKPETIATMFARPAGRAGHDLEGKPLDSYYSCGWFVRPVGKGGAANHWHTGSLDGTSTLLVGRHDGLNWAVLFNTRNGPRGEVPSKAIDPLLHQAADAVREWPSE